MYVSMHDIQDAEKGKAAQYNIERQSNTIQLARSSHFSKKNWLPRLGFEPMTFAI